MERQTNEENKLLSSNSHESREVNDNKNSILVIGSFAHCLGQLTSDTVSKYFEHLK